MSPVWRPDIVTCATMRSPSATISCTAKTSSEKEERSHRAVAWKPAGPGTRAAGGSAEASRLTAWCMHDGNEIGELPVDHGRWVLAEQDGGLVVRSVHVEPTTRAAQPGGVSADLLRQLSPATAAAIGGRDAAHLMSTSGVWAGLSLMQARRTRQEIGPEGAPEVSRSATTARRSAPGCSGRLPGRAPERARCAAPTRGTLRAARADDA